MTCSMAWTGWMGTAGFRRSESKSMPGCKASRSGVTGSRAPLLLPHEASRLIRNQVVDGAGLTGSNASRVDKVPWCCAASSGNVLSVPWPLDAADTREWLRRARNEGS